MEEDTQHPIDEHTKRCLGILNNIKQALQNSKDDKVQEELAKIINLMPSVEEIGKIVIIEMTDLALKNLTSDNPNMVLAKKLRFNLKIKVIKEISSFYQIFFSDSPTLTVVRGLFLILYVIPGVLFFIYDWFDPCFSLKDLDMDKNLLILVALSGVIGSIVSIMVRIRDFSSEKNFDPQIIFFSVLFKPIIGASFALFIALLISADLFPIKYTENGEANYSIYLVLAFISGFSERFAKDAIKRVEGTPTK
uniref:Uncharacterized protein n=1 Tax=Candidatus Kentrum sp. LFY TaxID=2126342 RepID=A0A450WV07_9GAMM|nr:MAG: hypothetical protein BECKLFY1418C_GA0070996_108020 [Candidatus Kentron sp. LFY]